MCAAKKGGKKKSTTGKVVKGAARLTGKGLKGAASLIFKSTTPKWSDDPKKKK
jgi:hypothetical protein